MIRVEAVNGRRGHRDFYKVKQRICSRYPQSVLPLRFMEWSQLDQDRHPFYQHAVMQMFVAYDESKQPVGRIIAVVDRMHQEYYQDRLGTFGFFESDDDPAIASRLLEHAMDWLRERDCNRVRGPLNPSMKGEFGVLVEGNDAPPFLMIAWTPDYYDALIRRSGFEVCKRFRAYLLDTVLKAAEMDVCHANLVALRDKVLVRYPEIQVARATRENVFDQLTQINRLGNTVRRDSYGFVPNTDEELNYLVQQVNRIIDPRLVITAHVNGQLAAYNVCVPNLNWAIRKATSRWEWIRTLQFIYWMKRIPEVRLIAVGVDPAIRAKGLSPLVTEPMVAMSAFFLKWEFSWIAEDNVASMAALIRGAAAEHYKTLQLYEREL